jgi:hypothetical protein
MVPFEVFGYQLNGKNNSEIFELSVTESLLDGTSHQARV